MPSNSSPGQPSENAATLKLLISLYLPSRVSLFGPWNPFVSITKSTPAVTLDV